MPKRKAPDENQHDHVRATSSTTINNVLHAKVRGLGTVLSSVQRHLSEIFTAATKLGNSFLLHTLCAPYDPQYLTLFTDPSYWNNCVEMVSTMRGEPTNKLKVNEQKQHVPRSGVKKLKGETKESFEVRRAQHANNLLQLDTEIKNLRDNKIAKPRQKAAKSGKLIRNMHTRYKPRRRPSASYNSQWMLITRRRKLQMTLKRNSSMCSRRRCSSTGTVSEVR